jgi:hypothetical protein
VMRCESKSQNEVEFDEFSLCVSKSELEPDDPGFERYPGIRSAPNRMGSSASITMADSNSAVKRNEDGDRIELVDGDNLFLKELEDDILTQKFYPLVSVNQSSCIACLGGLGPPV